MRERKEIFTSVSGASTRYTRQSIGESSQTRVGSSSNKKRAGEHCRDQEILLIGNADGAIRNALYYSPHRFSSIHPTVCNPIHHSVRSIVIRIGSDIDLQFLFINKLRIGCDAETSVGSSETERVFKKNATMLVRFQYPRHGITGCESNLVLHGRIGLLKIEIGW